jgi:NAD(P)-dependent dehydrogenase (short-subunit alcohol dehydrogenase family)
MHPDGDSLGVRMSGMHARSGRPGASKAILITGCSSGIGRATAVRLARAGRPVYATARRLDSIRDLEAVGCRILPLDVTDERSMREAVAAVEGTHGAVGVLVNNAGYSQSGAVEEVPIDAVRKQFETNFFGALRLCQLVLPGMRAQRWGRIVNMSSVGGRLAFPGGGVYHATKHALEAVSDVLRWEVRPFGIDVIVIEPGLIRSDFGRTAAESVEAIGAPDSPYREFNAAVAEETTSAYRTPFATGPDTVARAVERALEARRPRTRYVVTFGAHAVLGLRAILPDRAWDLALRTQFTTPPRPR